MSLAEARQRRQAALARAVTSRAWEAWARVDPERIAESWAELVAAVAVDVARGQFAAAAGSGRYVAQTVELSGETASGPAPIPSAFAGRAPNGQPLTAWLMVPAWRSLRSIGRGSPVAESLASGRFVLASQAETAVFDAGRASVAVAQVAEPAVRGWVRYLRTPSCARCIQLAGRVYSVSEGFRRHPRCDCQARPATAADVKAYRDGDTARDAFDAMSAAEQDAAFGRAGAQRIRDDGDLQALANAWRHKNRTAPAGRPKGEYRAANALADDPQVTAVIRASQAAEAEASELARAGETAAAAAARDRALVLRKAAYRMSGTPTVGSMPESLIGLAGANRDAAVALLRAAGYLR